MQPHSFGISGTSSGSSSSGCRVERFEGLLGLLGKAAVLGEAKECGELGRLLFRDCILLGAMAWSPCTTWPAKGEAVMTVSAEGVGGGVGECERKRGWMCASWIELERRRDGDTGKLAMDSVSAAGTMGDCMGESGSGSLSGVTESSRSGKGPSRGLAGDTGRLPGIASSLFLPVFGLEPRGFANPFSTAEVSQFSNPSPRHEISRESVPLVAAKLPESRGVTPCARINFVLEVIGLMTC
jgi:hypothetical protein